MGRPRKIKPLQDEVKQEGRMTEEIKPEDHLEAIRQEIDLARLELEKTKQELEDTKIEAQKISSRKIDADEQKIIDKQIATTSQNAGIQADIERQKKIDNEIITGRFLNRRAPGQPAKLTYMKYVDDTVKWWLFEDGKIYNIPRGFADQINEYYHTPKFVQKQGEMDPNRPASAVHEVDTSNKKYAFVPTDY